ncbi:unnamed protein product [Calicophoron daubneyi]|uniref:Uncharacterized protein n=1 Tax=Calicophoron daubneyi TaxID=300641 RepID=A0AAV2TWK2_CALDB
MDRKGNLDTDVINTGVQTAFEQWSKVKSSKRIKISALYMRDANDTIFSQIVLYLHKRSALLLAPELTKQDGGKSLEMQLNNFLPHKLTGRVSFKFSVLDFVGPVIFPAKAAANALENSTSMGTIPSERIKSLIKDILLKTQLFEPYEIKNISDCTIRNIDDHSKKSVVARTQVYFGLHSESLSTPKERFQFVRLVNRWFNEALKEESSPRFKNVNVQVFELLGPIKRSGRFPDETVKSNLTQWKEYSKPLREMIRLTLIRGRICRGSEVKEIAVTEVYKKPSVFRGVKIARSLVYLSSQASVFQNNAEVTEKFKRLFNKALKYGTELTYRSVNVQEIELLNPAS